MFTFLLIMLSCHSRIVSKNRLQISILYNSKYIDLEPITFITDSVKSGGYSLEYMNGQKINSDFIYNRNATSLLFSTSNSIENYSNSRVKEEVFEKISFDEYSAKLFIKNVHKNYRVYSPSQVKLAIDSMIDISLLEKQLDLMLPELSKLSKPSIILYLDNNNRKLKLEIWREYGLLSPIRIDNSFYYSYELLKHLYSVLPTEEKSSLDTIGIQNRIYSKIIEIIEDRLPSLGSTDLISSDSFSSAFRVKNTRLINGLSSTNWSGDRRLALQILNQIDSVNLELWASFEVIDMKSNFNSDSIEKRYYSEKDRILSIPLFRRFLLSNDKNRIVVIIDDGFPSQKVIQQSKSCLDIHGMGHLGVLSYLALFDSNGGLSNWLILSDDSLIYWLEFDFDTSFDTHLSEIRKAIKSNDNQVCELYLY